MHTGVISKWFLEKGYGFIRQDTGGSGVRRWNN
jgi:cold shock CspA family protein